MKREAAVRIAHETQHSYDQMAEEFSHTRAQFWEELVFLADHIERDDHVLDIGAGNGRFFPLVHERHAQYTGVDYAEGLVKEAKKKFPDGNFQIADATALPFPESTFDIAYSFAVIHHIPSRELRNEFVKEARRVIHPRGKLILTAWDLWSPKYFGKLLESAFHSLLRKNPLDIGDVMLTFGKNKHPRYVHACTTRELHMLLTTNGFRVLGVDRIARKSGEQNIVIIAERLD